MIKSDTFSNRLKKIMEERDLTYEKLAEIVQIPAQTLNRYVLGQRVPKIDDFEKIAVKLNTSPLWLQGFETGSDYLLQNEVRTPDTGFIVTYSERDHIKKFRMLDTYGKDLVSIVLEKEYARRLEAETTQKKDAGIILRLSQQPASAGTGMYLGPEAFTEITVKANEKTSRAAFAVRIQGDSMLPIFDDGDIVMVAKESTKIDDIVLVTLDGCGYVKRLGLNNLISANKKYQPIPLTSETIINGRVIGVLDPEWIQEYDPICLRV